MAEQEPAGTREPNECGTFAICYARLNRTRLHTVPMPLYIAVRLVECTHVAPPTKKKKNFLQKARRVSLVRDFDFFRVRNFLVAVQVVLYIATADAPLTHNRLQQNQQDPSGYSYPTPARSFYSVLCLGRKELLCDRRYTEHLLLFFSSFRSFGEQFQLCAPLSGGHRIALNSAAVEMSAHRRDTACPK